ncbi:hypothetical protein F6455_05250 [Proteobacteria bacterium 005FR1]|nr:hypothetical protein [Proteobacteria bacterium 005FR1]
MKCVQRLGIWAAMVVSFLVAVALWYSNTGPLSMYFAKGVPEGQLLYVLSKLLGTFALIGLTWQLLFALAGELQLVSPVSLRSWHHGLGFVVFALVLAHFLSFFAAASLRQNGVAWALWLPDLHDHYHTRLTFGLFALWMLMMVVVAGVLRMIWRGRLLAFIHRAYWLTIVFGYTHALTVGSEFQSQAGLVLVAVLLLALVCMAAWYGLRLYITCGSPETSS